MATLGIDIGGSSVKVAIMRDGAAIFRGQSNIYANPSASQLTDSIRSVFLQHLTDGIDSAGICVPGLLDGLSRRVMQSVNVPGLNGVALDELVAASVGAAVPVHIVNDATAA